MSLARLGEGLRGLAGWRRVSFGFAAGAFSATGFRADRIFSRTAAGLRRAGAAAGWRRSRPRPLAAPPLGWAFVFGQFLVGLHWVVYPFLVDPDVNLWQLPVALLLLQAGLGLFIALACGCRDIFWQAGTGASVALCGLIADGMAARPCADRLSLESARLWLGCFAGGDAGGFAVRCLWAFLSDDSARRVAGRVRMERGRDPRLR